MMKTNMLFMIRFKSLAMLLVLLAPTGAIAFPPAPPHEIYGMVRGEDGEPLSQASAEIILETDEGITVSGNVNPNLEPGVNYRLMVPMDAAITPDPYVENALTPLAPFRISVVIGNTTFLPIEMLGDYVLLGDVGASTRIDLTLGRDSDTDGMPDAWEEVVMAYLGGGLTLEDIGPDDDSDGDGMSNIDEYIAGTYAFDSLDAFKLYPTGSFPDAMEFTFLGIEGRSYKIEGSSNLTSWVDVPFTVPEASANSLFGFYPASETGLVVVEVLATNSTTFYRGRVQ